MYSLNPLSVRNFKGRYPRDYLHTGCDKFNGSLIEKDIYADDEFILADILFKNDFVDFKKTILDGKFPNKLIIDYIESNNLIDYRNFLIEIGFI